MAISAFWCDHDFTPDSFRSPMHFDNTHYDCSQYAIEFKNSVDHVGIQFSQEKLMDSFFMNSKTSLQQLHRGFLLGSSKQVDVRSEDFIS